MRSDIYIPEEIEYQDFLELKKYKHWWEFTKNSFSPKSIFRGHSNYHKHSNAEVDKLNLENEKAKNENKFDQRLPDNVNFSVWQTKSSFHRKFVDCDFWSFYNNYRMLLKNIDLYEKQLTPFLNDVESKDLTLLQILHLFQHYGISTPLIDFTKNPDTALYFSFSDLFDSGVMTNITDDCGNRFVTIVELKIDLLIEYSIIESIGDNHFIDSLDLNDNQFYFYEPQVRLNNSNIDLQEGVFIYLDSEMTMEAYISNKLIEREIASKVYKTQMPVKPFVWHIIPYSSLDFYSNGSIKKEDYNLFAYLLAKRKLGCYLYSDIKGIERDMMNSNINFECIKNPVGCECLKKLKLSDIF